MKVQKEMRMRLKVGLLTVALLAVAAAARANLTVIVGAHDLLANTPNQVVPIFVIANGGEGIQGTQFRVQQGDGGVDFGGSDVGPSMVGDIIGPGTIFATNNVGATDAAGGATMYIDLGTATTGSPAFNVLSAGQNLGHDHV